MRKSILHWNYYYNHYWVPILGDFPWNSRDLGGLSDGIPGILGFPGPFLGDFPWKSQDLNEVLERGVSPRRGKKGPRGEKWGKGGPEGLIGVLEGEMGSWGGFPCPPVTPVTSLQEFPSEFGPILMQIPRKFHKFGSNTTRGGVEGTSDTSGVPW